MAAEMGEEAELQVPAETATTVESQATSLVTAEPQESQDQDQDQASKILLSYLIVPI